MSDIHSCGYYCDRPACIKAQRDELRDKLAQPEQESFSPEAISATQAAWKMGYDAAKAEQPEEEPVAYYHPHKGFYWAKPTRISAPTAVDVKPLPLYAAPPQRKPLTDEQIAEALGFGEHTTATTRAILTHAARAIEAKIKENK